MNRSLRFLLALSLVSVASVAQAQQPGAEATPAAPAQPTAAAPAGAAAGEEATGAKASAAVRASCDLGEIGTLSEKQAHVWRALLCDELAKQGIAALPGAAGAQDIYRLDLLTLDKKMVVRLTHEKGAGSKGVAERAVISGDDELLVVLPRLVAAVNKGENFEQTATVSNLVAQDARPLVKRHGDLLYSATLFGAAPLGMSGVDLMPGIGVGVHYETPAVSLAGDLRYAFKDTGSTTNTYQLSPTATWFSLSVGARTFFSDSDISPYAGGGLALGWLSFPTATATQSYAGVSQAFENSGVGAYAEIGVEILRTHRHRFSLSLRADVPFYSAILKTGASESSSGSAIAPATSGSHYVVPLSFAATYYFLP